MISVFICTGGLAVAVEIAEIVKQYFGCDVSIKPSHSSKDMFYLQIDPATVEKVTRLVLTGFCEGVDYMIRKEVNYD